MTDKPASTLRRGDRVWIGGKGWRALSSVRRHIAHWIGEGEGPAVRLVWRGGLQDVKPDAQITVKGAE